MGFSQAEIDALMAGDDGPARDSESSYASAVAVAEPVKAPPAAQTAAPKPPAPPPAARKGGDVERILKLTVPVIVKLAEEHMPVKRVLDLNLGSILEFNRSFDSDLDLLIANQRIGQGQTVKVGENFGMRITRISSLRTKIKALGSS